ncbi:ABC transporter substrate-binding protein [Sphaerisporangium corydalis]|uniref:ABC transporter substrate-binding protein n=1 Tax=Sphaerisporangium corydalis TaxID=1441875 RepID=A0ABV9ETY7_9ACTN|nr:ABC transporter substrate-binding protein [Sphaerisporangium corydalis]
MRSLRGRTFIVGVVAILALTACGNSNGSSTASGDGKALEKTTISVGVLAIADVAALYIADQQGFFKAEGLTVQPKILQSTAVTLPQLMGGQLDFALANYFSVLSATENKAGSFRFVADTYEAKNDVFSIMVTKDSKIQTVKDLEGKKISVAAPNSIGTLAVGSTLKVAGLDPNKGVQFVPMPFPNAPAALKSGQVDAAWLTEPFLTNVQKEFGARKIADTMTGAMADFPIAGWAATESWTKKYPNTTAAFQRAILKGQQAAAADRKAVEKVLPSYTHITPDVAAVINLGAYPTSLNAQRIQRVADLMVEYGYLKAKMDVKPLLVPLPQ